MSEAANIPNEQDGARGPEYLTRRELALELGICLRSLDKIVKDNAIPLSSFGRLMRFRRDHVEEFKLKFHVRRDDRKKDGVPLPPFTPRELRAIEGMIAREVRAQLELCRRLEVAA